MDSLSLLAEIKVSGRRTPTVLITGHGERDLAIQALRGGAYDFVQAIDRDYFVASLESEPINCAGSADTSRSSGSTSSVMRASSSTSTAASS